METYSWTGDRVVCVLLFQLGQRCESRGFLFALEFKREAAINDGDVIENEVMDIGSFEKAVHPDDSSRVES